MRNKKLRNTLLALALTPFFAFSATGCWNATPEDLSQEQQVEAYSILRNHLINENYVINSGSNAIEISDNSQDTITTDWSNSSIPEDQRESVAENLEIPVDKETYEYQYAHMSGYNYLDNTGYEITKNMEYDKDENNNRLETESFKITDMNFVKKVGDEYLYYNYYYNYYDKDNKSLYRVDDKYAVNTYPKTEEFSGSISDTVLEFLDIIKEKETPDSFKQSMIDSSDIAIDENNINLEISKTDKTYSLVLTVNAEGSSEDYDLITANANLTINFNDKIIENVIFDIDQSYQISINCKDELNSSLGITFDDDDHILLTESTSYHTSNDFINDFDQSIINQDVSDYKPTGSMGDIKNKDVTLRFKYVDFEDFYGDGYHSTYNKLLNLSKYSSQYFTNDHVTKTYYWDKECTKPVLSSDTAPSYETNIYVKLTIDDGYAAVMQNIIYPDGYSDSSNPKVVNISTEKYNLYVYYDIIKVVINGKEITDYDNGITLTESGIYTINVHVSN